MTFLDVLQYSAFFLFGSYCYMAGVLIENRRLLKVVDDVISEQIEKLKKQGTIQ